jgi:hypothetical protein
MPKPDSIAKLAKTNFEAALRFASTIEDTGKRIQALGWVARFAPAPRVESTVHVALGVALAPTEDAYGPLMALAWPMRALVETQHVAALRPALVKALRLAPQVEPTSSRAEALGLLVHAVLPAGIEAVRPVLDALLKQCSGDDHWRIVRALASAALLVNSCDSPTAHRLANALPAGNKREELLAKLAAGKSSPARKFFW